VPVFYVLIWELCGAPHLNKTLKSSFCLEIELPDLSFYISISKITSLLMFHSSVADDSILIRCVASLGK